jgi:hypothetical protein
MSMTGTVRPLSSTKDWQVQPRFEQFHASNCFSLFFFGFKPDWWPVGGQPGLTVQSDLVYDK